MIFWMKFKKSVFNTGIAENKTTCAMYQLKMFFSLYVHVYYRSQTKILLTCVAQVMYLDIN